jgi:hypothetical protein
VFRRLGLSGDLWFDAFRLAACVVALAAMLTGIYVVMEPWFKDTTTFGFHDWDVQTSHRYLTLLSLGRYHELPGWDPYLCGGFPAWGFVESDTNLVSPFFPLYVFFPLSLALRLEVVGFALISAAGCYIAASRYTASHAARALVAVLFATNGRWALQIAAGHTWHLAYAWMPWCLYFFERARREDRRVVDLLGGAICIAMLVYSGGIYPLPHTLLLLGLYALLLSVFERSARPLATLALVGGLGAGLAAPKLFPILDGFGKAPRLVESTESLDLGAFVTLLTSPDQSFYSRPAHVSPYGWHEWGMYIGTAGLCVLLAALVFVEGRRETLLRAVGAVFLLLGFGAFHPSAPWTFLHTLPVFRSQHVPSRFLYTAVLLFGLVAASGAGRFITKRNKRWPWLDVVAALVVLEMALDISSVAQKPMTAAMWMVPPDNIPKNRPFHFEQEPPLQYKRRDWAGPQYLAMLANTGVINCYGAPPFERRGARPVTAADYHGEAYLLAASGKVEPARVVEFSPNRATIELETPQLGGLVVYNMNFDEGWHSDVGAVEAYKNAVAARVAAGTRRITFWYRPPGLRLGLCVAGAAIAVLVVLRRREGGLVV